MLLQEVGGALTENPFAIRDTISVKVSVLHKNSLYILSMPRSSVIREWARPGLFSDCLALPVEGKRRLSVKIWRTLRLVLMIVFAGLFQTLQTNAAEGVRHRFITVGTGSPSGVYFAAGQAICKAVNRLAERRAAQGDRIVTSCRAGPSGGSAFNIRQVASGAFTFVIAQANDQRAAIDGSDPDRVQNVPGLRSVVSLHPEVLHIVLPHESAIKSVVDFSNRRISPGNRGSGTRVMAQQLISAHGLTDADYEQIQSLTMDKQAEAFCAGQIDAFVTVSAVPARNVLEAQKECGMRLLPLEGEEVRALLSDIPDLVDTVVPAGLYPGIETPIPSVGVRAGLVTRDLVPDIVVRDVLEAIFKDLPLIRAAHPSLASLEPRGMATEGHGAPLHAAALAYFEERGWH